MSPLSASDVESLVAALSEASTGGGPPSPGRLRQRLEAALSPDDLARFRPQVHHLVAAAEENIPATIARIAPLTADSLRRLSSELAQARGWNEQTARQATEIWAAALGFGDLVASSWEPLRPSVSLGVLPVDQTAAPPAPGSEPMGDPVPASTPVAWPATRRRLAKAHATSTSGEPALSAWGCYTGLRLELFAAIVGAVVVAAVLLVVIAQFVLGGIPVLLVVLALKRAQAPGVLVATASGIELVPYTALGGKPQLDKAESTPWSDVTVEEGLFSTVHLGARRAQLGPSGRQFARCLAARAQGPRR